MCSVLSPHSQIASPLPRPPRPLAPWTSHSPSPSLCLPCAAAICFKMLRDLNSSDPIRLKYIVKKIKSMAYKAPNLVLETIHDYFADNPEVGLAQAPPGRHGEQSGGWSPRRAHLWASPCSSDMVWGKSTSSCPMG